MTDETPRAAPDGDVLVIGGGPAGSTVAALLARRGRRVLLVEKDRHPRFHIGESLLPLNLPIFERLGVLDRVAAIGVAKYGADFPSPGPEGYNTFRFARSLTPCADHAFQVDRATFDAMLFEHARGCGVDAREGVRISAVDLDASGVTAYGRDASGLGCSLRARYLVDATGRDTLLGRQLGLKRRNRRHVSAALFAHFRGVARRPGADEGNISVYRFDHGWIWMIPLPHDRMSIGAVCSPEYLRRRQGRNAEFLQETLQAVPQAWARMDAAELLGQVHATGNYTYACRRWAGPRWIMAGDACAFVDPIFSTGVLLAMRSAERAAELVDRVLDAPAEERTRQRDYVRDLRRGIDGFSWFIERFNTPAMRHLFANPRDVWQVEQAMIAMLSGDVFSRGAVPRRLLLFRVLYYLTALRRLPQTLRDLAARRRHRRIAFEGGTTVQDHA